MEPTNPNLNRGRRASDRANVRKRWLLYWLLAAIFIGALADLTLAWGDGSIIEGVADVIAACVSGWLLIRLGKSLGLGPAAVQEPVRREYPSGPV